MARHFGLQNATNPTTVGGNQSPGSHSRAGQRDSNVVELFPSHVEAPRADDQNFAALFFAMAAFASPWALVGCGVTIWLLFF